MYNGLPSISEEFTIEECCAAIAADATPMENKIAMILTLASKFSQKEELTADHADVVLLALPADLVEEAFLPGSITFLMYQELLTSVLTTLLSSCSLEVLQKKNCFYKYLLSYLERKKLVPKDVETLVCILSCLVQRCQSMQGEALQCLNLLGKAIAHDPTNLPALEVLENCNKAIEHLASSSTDCLRVDSEIVKSLKIFIPRILKSPPQRLADDYRRICFSIMNALSDIFGPSWFSGSQQLLSLVAHLVSMQFRIILDEPSNINLDELITCASLAEVCIRSVDEDDIVDDNCATIISKAVKEQSDFIVEYWYEAMLSDEILSIEVQLVLYRYLCVFLAIGGSQLIDKDRLNKVSPFAFEVCHQAVKNKNFEIARQLICVLEHLPKLDSERTLSTLMDYAFGADDPTEDERKEQVLEVLDALLPRSDWYSRSTLVKAIECSRSHGDERFTTLLKSI